MITPIVLWAETSEIIILTIDILNSQDNIITLTDNNLAVKGISEGTDFLIDIELFEYINTNKSYWKINDRNIEFTLYKVNNNIWGKLSSKKYNNVRTDWRKWNDLEDSDSEADIESDSELNNSHINLESIDNLDSTPLDEDLDISCDIALSEEMELANN